MVKRECKWCGGELINVHPNRRFCGKECLQQNNNKKSRLRYKNNPLEYRETRKRYAKSENAKEFYRKTYYKNREKILIRKRDRDRIIKVECYYCKSKKELEIHHISYEPNINIVLCKKCHLRIHNKRSIQC